MFLKVQNNSFLRNELDMYLQNNFSPFQGWVGFVWLLNCYPEYRNVLYMRVGGYYSKIMSKIHKGQMALYLPSDSSKVGANLMIWHGFSTIVNAKSIGDNCSIWQQVTIGNKLDNDEAKPIIGNNVKICAGAIIVGDITIGDNAIIGAGTVIVKDVPSGAIMVGSSARQIQHR